MAGHAAYYFPLNKRPFDPQEPAIPLQPSGLLSDYKFSVLDPDHPANVLGEPS
jgi:hypothetical protein